MNLKKDIIIVTTAVVLIGSVGYWGFIKKGITIIPQSTLQEETGDWKTYKNEKYGYEIKYPLNFVFEPFQVYDSKNDLPTEIGPNDGGFLNKIKNGERWQTGESSAAIIISVATEGNPYEGQRLLIYNSNSLLNFIKIHEPYAGCGISKPLEIKTVPNKFIQIMEINYETNFICLGGEDKKIISLPYAYFVSPIQSNRIIKFQAGRQSEIDTFYKILRTVKPVNNN